VREPGNRNPETGKADGKAAFATFGLNPGAPGLKPAVEGWPEMRVAGILGTAKIALDTGHHADYI
jgi:hypothetical protein